GRPRASNSLVCCVSNGVTEWAAAVCELSKAYFAMTFLSSSPTTSATQSDLFGAFIPFMGFASSPKTEAGGSSSRGRVPTSEAPSFPADGRACLPILPQRPSSLGGERYRRRRSRLQYEIGVIYDK